ncbi:SAF domain-containing protein [Saccharibacillus sp. CPCC 101409]|uniref:SAF domain-containing protein n=1 Tax=Saccharibacillus sp. CPCC 101409 TaxID=3058041 RepID=UPI002672B2A6|nr:SAF domain-containing protein [Saccharibacillus sp. CPCC 101409]MDO3412842.1 SAF domain-containing protein [Saccharibacillus sp. CPCC 101409]
MSRIRFRQRQKLLAAAAGAAAALLLSTAAGTLYVRQIEQDYREDRSGYEQQIAAMEAQRIPVYALTRDIKAGQKISENDLTEIEVVRDTVPADMPKRKDAIGRYSKIALSKNTPLTSEMLYEGAVTPSDLRSQEFRLIELPTRLAQGDYVDVRVKFPTGEDFIVLSKKKTEDLASGTIWVRMNEREILTMSSAVVDAYLNDASIYAVSYIEPGLQQAAVVTYPSNSSVLDLIESDPNIVERAKTELERRMRDKLETGLDLLTPEEIQKYLNNKANASAVNPGTQSNSLIENSRQNADETGGAQTEADIFTDGGSTDTGN